MPQRGYWECSASGMNHSNGTVCLPHALYARHQPTAKDVVTHPAELGHAAAARVGKHVPTGLFDNASLQQTHPAVLHESHEEGGAVAVSGFHVDSQHLGRAIEVTANFLAPMALIQRAHEETGIALRALKRMSQRGTLQRIPLDDHGRFTSIGAALHVSGECKPCVLWFAQRCTKSILCTFCHLTHPGQRRKRIRASKRVRERESMLGLQR